MSDIVKQLIYALGLFLLFLAAELALAQHIDLTLNQRGPNGESQYRFLVSAPLCYISLTAGTVLCLYCFIIPRHLRRIKKQKELEKSKGGRYDTYGAGAGYDWTGGSGAYASGGYDDFTAGLNKAKSDNDLIGDDELSDKDLAKLKKIMKAMKND